MSSIDDSYFGLVDLFLPFDGADSATLAVDASLRNRAVSAPTLANFRLDATQSRFGGTSGRFTPSGSGYPISVTNITPLQPAPVDFTVEFWVRFPNFSGDVRGLYYVGTSSALGIVVLCDSFATTADRRKIALRSASTNLCLSQVLSTDTWYHVAWSREGSTTRLFVDGVLRSSTTTPYTFAPHTQAVLLGTVSGQIGNTADCWIDDFRYTRDFARYTADFTPPGAIIDYTPNNIVARADTVALNLPRAIPAPTAPRLLESPVGITRNVWTRGNGRVAGTVKEASTPADLPLRRVVRLVNQRDGRIYGETWSDATTGEYVFENIDETQKYFVISHDHTANYNAVVKDGITPEAMP